MCRITEENNALDISYSYDVQGQFLEEQRNVLTAQMDAYRNRTNFDYNADGKNPASAHGIMTASAGFLAPSATGIPTNTYMMNMSI